MLLARSLRSVPSCMFYSFLISFYIYIYPFSLVLTQWALPNSYVFYSYKSYTH
ncbi:hypothetical protein BCR42DRAFT_401901 [Absidia repens]|uniref:Uncharacterized protein n=1 Tax=Absidia repens TaxID=90262 RepID=A0A1X2IXD9_9FUNG|nr:hypothetical protein BCR42DRAFT_401901 [Absidia repens]